MARKQQTLADYVVTALSPLLIMLLVGSLTFFLLEIIYVGDRKERVQWVLFWFVFATVLIARIGIEQGRAYAAVYAAGMAVACGLFAAKFLPQYLTGVAVLLLVIWWCADKLTWDCTFIDDGEDASGAGLLQQAGIDSPPPDAAAAGPIETEKQRLRRLRREAKARAEQPPDERSSATPEPKSDPARRRRKPRTHAPGVWVVYFSLLALPLFGLGQTRLPMDQPDARTFAFRMLWVYVAAALGLLLTTSFLGLRRYLRQRNIQMPAKITAGWLTTGALLALAVMVLCLIIPQPQSDTSLTAALDRFADEHRASDRAFVGNDGGEGDGERAAEPRDAADQAQAGEEQAGNGRPRPGENGNEPDPKAEPSRKPGEADSKNTAKASQQPGESANESSQSAEAESPPAQETSRASNSPENQTRDPSNASERPPGNNDPQQREENQQPSRQTAQNRDSQERPESPSESNAGNERPDDQRQQPQGNPPPREGQREEQAQNAEQQPDGDARNEPEPQAEQRPAETSSSSSWLSTLATGLKWLIYLVLGLLILWMLWKNRHSILQGAADFFRAIADFWRRLFSFSATRADTGSADAPAPVNAGRRFSDFDDPFLTGSAYRMSPDALALYSFEALRAFAREQGLRPAGELTPIELGRELETLTPELGKGIGFLTQIVSRILYSQSPPRQFDVAPLQHLWQGMTQMAHGAAREPVASK